MKRNDLLFVCLIALIFLPFALSADLLGFYNNFNASHGLIMSFFKFALLATLGEVLGLRIKSGGFQLKGFGLLPRAFVWGLLGITIKLAFVIFTNGTLAFISYVGFHEAGSIFAGSVTISKVLIAFSISVAMNTIFAPLMMTLHKITDTHIMQTGGSFKGFLLNRMHVATILKQLNWDVQWNFVFLKTIPFFWFPAHTITFLLPADLQVLFAALLGIALGAILAFASGKSRAA